MTFSTLLSLPSFRTFLLVLLAVLLLLLLGLAASWLYGRLWPGGAGHKRRRRRYTLYDDNSVSYGMRQPLIRSASMGAAS